MPRGTGERCTGFLSSGADYAFCTREEKSGKLELNQKSEPPAYAHKLEGDCKCGVQHGDAPPVAKAARKSQAKKRGPIECTYPYHDATGKLQFEVVRYREPKDFLQRRPVAGGWEWNLKGVDKMLYRLPELLDADVNDPVFVPEGEKDVENLRALGLTATCNPGGASKGQRSKWTSDILRPLRGRLVVFLPDNDRAGKDHAIAGATLLSAHAGERYILELPGLGDGGDISDWLALNNHDPRTALDNMWRALPKFTPPEPPEVIENRSEHPGGDGVNAYTDTRNARRMVAKYGEQIRYDHTRGQWRMWDSKVWAQDETERIMRLAKDVVKDIHKELKGKDLEPKEYREELKEILAIESTGRLKAMAENARSDVFATHKTWDTDPYLFNCANGTIDLRDGSLLPHRPERWQSKLAPVAYEPDAKCPKWDAFLLRIFDNDADLISFVQRSVGLSMLGSVLEHVLYVLWGSGANGKSTFLNVVMEIMGDYSRAAAPDLLMARETPQHSTNIAELRGVRLVSAVETQMGGRISEALVKMLTGGDVRNCRFLFQDAFTYVPSDTFWLATNHKPVVTGNSEGIWRRLKLIPFNVSIPAEEQDRKLAEHLRDEHPGILAWAVRGCLEYQKRNLDEPLAVRAATAGYRTEMDTLNAWLEECCIADEGARITSSELYKNYVGWCQEAGEKTATQRFLGLRLGERGYVRTRFYPGNRWGWKGLRLRAPHEMGDDDDELVEMDVESEHVPQPVAAQTEISTEPPLRAQFETEADFVNATRAFWGKVEGESPA